MEVLISVDPHKATNAAVAIDEHGELVGQAAGVAAASTGKVRPSARSFCGPVWLKIQSEER
jgi:hypothetical protein